MLIFSVINKIQKYKIISHLTLQQWKLMSLNYFNPFFSVKVMDGLFICNQTAVKEQDFIINNKFSLIINTCPRQFKVLPITNIYKVTNFHWQNSKGQLIETINMTLFKPMFQQITHNLEQGQGTLIVSDRGHSRSITFALVYLMDKFGWELFKALEYINSKRQNLSVRATYLKLLVNYEKVIKGGPQLQINAKKNNDDNELANHIRESKSSEKWSQHLVKSTQQRLISNTFKNTFKKRHINEINEWYRAQITQTKKQQKRSYSSNNRQNQQQSNQRGERDRKKRGKSVQFSNEIEIIINQSPMTHVFPQYNELSSENDHDYINQYKQNHAQRQLRQKEQQHNESQGQKRQSTRPLQTKSLDASQSSSLLTNNKETSNVKMINVRKIQNLNAKPNHPQSLHILQLDQEDIYQNQFFEKQRQEQLQVMDSNLSLKKCNSQSNSMQDNRQSLLFNSSLYKLEKEKKNSKVIKENQIIIHENQIIGQGKLSTQHQTKNTSSLTKKTRLSSYKKLKATFIENHFKNAFSPQRKEKVYTEPKFQLQLQEKQRFADQQRKATASHKDENGFFQKQQIYQKKSGSSTMGLKAEKRFEKKGSSSYKAQKRCQTPQIVDSQSLLINNQSLSAHNNMFNRPLSREKSNSVRVKKEQDEKGSSKEKNIFNININVNIGKLQMFGGKKSDGAIRESSAGKEKIFKNYSQVEKMNLIHSRPRSNSSNDYYSKFSVSSGNDHKKELSSQKIEQRSLNKIYQQKLSKGILKISENKVTPQNSNLLESCDQFPIPEQILLGSESFSKREIIDKINRKLINNSRGSKRPTQNGKGNSVLQNNFL